MALENARLYQELRHQAFHGCGYRLSNRGALLTDRLEHASLVAIDALGAWRCCSST